MSSFASLMALSATHTKESQVAVQHALQERQRKEAAQRKQQEEREAKERELEKQVRLRRFEEEKLQKEKMERIEAQRRAMEATRERKEEEKRNALLYGPRKAKIISNGSGSPKYPQSTAAKEAAAKHRSGDNSDGDGSGGLALTREELRQRKREAELRKQFARSSTKKNSSSGSRKGGHCLPGGAVNIVVNAKGESATPITTHSDLSSGKSLKERLTQGPNTLVLLQTKARDRRTVDEAQQDIRIKLGKATPKVLSGEEARSFDDWFGSSKDKEKSFKEQPPSRSTSSTPGPAVSSSTTLVTSNSSTLTNKNAVSSISRPPVTKPTATAAIRPSASRATAAGKDLSSSQGTKLQKSSKSPTPISSTSYCTPSSRDPVVKQKRRRSPVRSESPAPKRHREDYVEGSIWKMITGRDRDTFAARDIDSDDDMEADTFALEREEHVSTRIALKEDMQALEEERRHEEEKRRRKKEKQRAPPRGY